MAWDNIAAPRTGILERLASSDEPPQAPHNPREHHTDLVPLWQFMEYWNKLSPAQQDQHWDEMREPFEEQESEAPSPPGGLQRPDPWSWAEIGERRHVRSSRRLDQIEGVHTPVPPEPSEESKE